jgi:hypothetical protein
MVKKRTHDDHPRRSRGPHRARASLSVRGFEARAEVEITSGGLLAVGGLVSAILLSVTPIILAATRKLPPRD